MTKRLWPVGAVMLLQLLAAGGAAQVVVELPSLSIEGTSITSTVEFDVARNVYIYEYEVIAASTNEANISGFNVDISGRVERVQIDSALQNSVDRNETGSLGALQPPDAIPVGITAPPGVLAAVSQSSKVGFGFLGATKVGPGESKSGFRIESRMPPAWRTAVVRPAATSWNAITAELGTDVTYEPVSPSIYNISVKVLAPYDLDEATLFSGGGQSPREVDPFLRYVTPEQSRSQLPVGTTDYQVSVVFGNTIVPSTFSATLNGDDVTHWFQPMAGVTETVTIPLFEGTTKLQLSIEGTTSSGRGARDSDTLTFIVK